MTTEGYGSTKTHFEMEVERGSRLIFVEFLVFIAILAKIAFSPLQHKIQAEVYNDDVRSTL
jgi:hypothetical protein